MTNYEEFAKQKNLKERSVEAVYDESFMKDMRAYVDLFMKSEYPKQFIYHKMDKSVFYYPYLGFIGKMGLSNVYNGPFYTCCRYAVLEQARKEVEEGNKVLDELVVRLSQAKKVMPNIPESKQKEAQDKFDRLSLTLNLVLTGLGLVEDMDQNLKDDSQSLDLKYENEAAKDWKELLKKTGNKGKWGF